jgi:hypothetical protein
MSRHRAPRPIGPAVARLVLAVVAASGAVLALTSPSGPAPAPASPPGPVAVAAAAPAVAAAPIRVRVPSVGVDSPLAPLGTDAAGALVPPEDFARAGWFTGGPAPGEIGPAVVAGHVDSWTGPAVFFRLHEISAGAEVLVDRADGTTVRFAVTRVARYAKDDFPTDEVYGPTTGAELRLVTCGGEFDPARRSYLENVVVYARSASQPT